MALPRLSFFYALIVLAFVPDVSHAQSPDPVAWVETQAKDAHILTIAAEPGMADTAHMLNALVPTLGKAGYGAYGISMGPWMAANLEDIAERGGDELERYLAELENARQMQVLNSKESITLLRSIGRHWSSWPRNIWGIDQEFLTSAPFLLERLSLFVADDSDKAAILSYRDVAKSQDFYLATAEDAVFDHLRTLFPEDAEEPHALIDEMALSKHIYGPFLENTARMKKAHERREALLFENFLRYMRDSAPKVIIELPAAHLHGQKTPLDVPSFGNSLRKYAKAKKQKMLSIAVLCGPDGQRRLVEGGIRDCAPGFAKKYPTLIPLVEGRLGPVLIFPSAIEPETEALQRLLSGFDAVLVFPDARPAMPASEIETAKTP